MKHGVVESEDEVTQRVKGRFKKDKESSCERIELRKQCSVSNCIAPELEPAKVKGIASAAMSSKIHNKTYCCCCNGLAHLLAEAL